MIINREPILKLKEFILFLQQNTSYKVIFIEDTVMRDGPKLLWKFISYLKIGVTHQL